MPGLIAGRRQEQLHRRRRRARGAGDPGAELLRVRGRRLRSRTTHLYDDLQRRPAKTTDPRPDRHGRRRGGARRTRRRSPGQLPLPDPDARRRWAPRRPSPRSWDRPRPSGPPPRASTRCATRSPTALGFPKQNVRVVYVEGPGCYGLNGADNVALDAAVISQRSASRCASSTCAPTSTSGRTTASPICTRCAAGSTRPATSSAWDYVAWTASRGGRPGPAREPADRGVDGLPGERRWRSHRRRRASTSPQRRRQLQLRRPPT